MEWRSPEGFLVLLEDSGEVTAAANRIKISALVSGTTYQFRVSAVTQSGRGSEVTISGQTQPSQGMGMKRFTRSVATHSIVVISLVVISPSPFPN